MKIQLSAFNLYLAIALILCGCKSPSEKKEADLLREQKKEITAIRFHLEAPTDRTARTERVSVLRSSPIWINISGESFLDERDVLSAQLLDYFDGFIIKIQFDDHGTFVLEGVSASNKGMRVAVNTEAKDSRWIAAPVIRQKISDGLLVFTPDATRSEAERIVRGINNTVAKYHKKPLLKPW